MERCRLSCEELNAIFFNADELINIYIYGKKKLNFPFFLCVCLSRVKAALIAQLLLNGKVEYY